MIAPPIPINEDTKPTIKPRNVLCNKVNFNLIFVLSLRKIKLRASKYIIILKKRTKNMLHKNIDHMQHRTLKPVVQQDTITTTTTNTKTTNNKKNIFPLFKKN